MQEATEEEVKTTGVLEEAEDILGETEDFPIGGTRISGKVKAMINKQVMKMLMMTTQVNT